MFRNAKESAKKFFFFLKRRILKRILFFSFNIAFISFLKAWRQTWWHIRHVLLCWWCWPERTLTLLASQYDRPLGLAKSTAGPDIHSTKKCDSLLSWKRCRAPSLNFKFFKLFFWIFFSFFLQLSGEVDGDVDEWGLGCTEAVSYVMRSSLEWIRWL